MATIRTNWTLLLLQLFLQVCLFVTVNAKEYLSEKTKGASKIAILSSDNELDVIAEGSLINSTKLSGVQGYPYAFGVTDTSVRVVSKLGNEFFITELGMESLLVQNTSRLHLEQGSFVSVQFIAVFAENIFLYDRGLNRVFLHISGNKFATEILESDEEITSIDFDPCDRALLWTSGNSIKRLSLDNKAVETVLSDLGEARAVAVDHVARKMFWLSLANDRDEVLRLETGEFDASSRRLVCEIQKSYVIKKMSVDVENVLFVDWKNLMVWSLPKSGRGCELKAVERKSNFKPVDVISHTSVNDSCESVREILTLSTLQTNVETSTDSLDSRSSLGFGADACHNYCVQPDVIGLSASCSVTAMGVPVCHCPAGFSGKRCQVDLCANFCLHGGVCTLRLGLPECTCNQNFTGSRCSVMRNATNVSKISDLTFCDFYFEFVLSFVAAAIMLVILIIVAVLSCRGRSSSPRHAPQIVTKPSSHSRVFSGEKSSFQRSSGYTNASVVSEPVTCPNGVILDLEDCCQMTLCDQPCGNAIFRKPSHLRSRGQQHQEISDTDALLNEETLS